MNKNISTMENRKFYFFEKGHNNYVIMKKHILLNYKFYYRIFGNILALYEHFWMTYAKKSWTKKQKIAHFPKTSIDNSLIIQECG